MVLGWGKKPETKQDEEDMTMDEILASIRRYVTEDQNPSREGGASSSLGQQSEPFRAEPSLPSQPKADIPSAALRETSYEKPYDLPERGKEHISSRDLPPASWDSSPAPEKNISSSLGKNAQVRPSSPAEVPYSPKGVTEETTISAAATALSKLAAMGQEHHHASSGNALTLDRLITDLARPMIKKWLDENLPQIVETMVQQEIERIRNYLK